MMTIKEVIEALIADRGPIIAIFLIATTLVQIAPIKINPWSALLRWIGNQLNKEVIAKIDDVDKRLNEHIRDSMEEDIRVRRASILDFGSSVIRGVNYHKEKFNAMINECDSYEKYCEDNHIINGVATASIAEIRRIYQEHLRNNDFLVEKGVLDESNKKGTVS